MRLDPRHIVIGAERLEDCQASLEEPLHEMIDHALSRGSGRTALASAMDRLSRVL